MTAATAIANFCKVSILLFFRAVAPERRSLPDFASLTAATAQASHRLPGFDYGQLGTGGSVN